MLNLPDLASQMAALDQPLDCKLHDLLTGRIKDALALDLGDLTHIVVIQPRDTDADIIEALGFSPLVSRIDGIRLEPDWDCPAATPCARQTGTQRLTFRNDDGLALRKEIPCLRRN